MVDGDPIVSGISAAVLAGGASRRMGTDKALLEVAGRPLLARVIEVLRGLGDDVFVVGDRAQYRRFGARVVPDAYPGAGALGGIATALRHAQYDVTVVVACDMPFLSVEVLQAMALEPRDYDVLVPVKEGERSTRGGDRTFETLHAIYSRACLPVIEQCIQRGDLKVTDLFSHVRVRVLSNDWVRAIDPDGRSTVNVNDPAELQRVRQLWESLELTGGTDL
jgi:molybdopterin-guanine dinucleotide biosynthesis protein A